jgi:acyl dehydratase
MIFTHRFSLDQQLRFAELSGDANPLHVDPLEARRTLLGAPAGHGMHLVLLALRALHETETGHLRVSAIHCHFRNPVLVGDSVEFRVKNAHAKSSDAKARSVDGYVESDIAFEMRVELEPSIAADEDAVPDLRPTALQDWTFPDLAGMSGVLPVGIAPNLARSLFPDLVDKLGLPVLAELLALTRLVGMRCPGRHSLFSRFDVSIRAGAAPCELQFRVTAADERFKRVTILVEGARLTGKLIAFLRPPPQPQPSSAELLKLLRPDEFSGSAALVVGGSRGLGEITAKLLAAGGARVVISYHRGEQDAARVAGEIERCGGSCEYIGLDVLDSGSAILNLYASAFAPRTIYYFATSHIFARRRAFFSPDLLQSFIDHYVIGFARLIETAASQSQTKLRVFCPSSVAVVENLRELAEYSMAKRMAEDLCAFYNRFSDKVRCVVERLPRVRTDQTATLLDVPNEDTVSIMLPIIRRIEYGPE